MASLVRQAKGFKVSFYCHNGTKRGLWVGAVGQRAAETVKSHIEDLIDSRKLAIAPKVDTTKWVIEVEERIRDLLLKYDLIDKEVLFALRAKRITCKEVMETYILEKKSVSAKWKINFDQAKSWFFKFFPDDKPLASLSSYECSQWHEWMLLGDEKRKALANTTAGQHVKRVRQILANAVQQRLIPVNPLVGVRASSVCDESKKYMVDAEDVELIIAETPSMEWAAIIALSRFGGLRCPSEVMKLRWSDIHWDKDKLLIRSQKTSRYGRETRWFPITANLKKYLLPLHDLVLPGLECEANAHVVQCHRKENLRTQFARFVERAGLEPLPLPFNNLRASARCDFEQSKLFTPDELERWFGHSDAVARKYYGRMARDSFAKAANANLGGGSTGGSASVGNERQPATENAKNPEKREKANV